RTLKEKEKMARLVMEDLIKELLPVVDDLERALNSAKQSKNLPILIDGVEMVLNQLKNVLKKQGLKEIKAEGEEFNPYLHEAVMQVSFSKYPDNLVVEEMRKGYKLNDRILRPSMVKVNKKTGKTGKDKNEN
ncbi:MAG: nucleotide exchange factor GrpE, partial [Candidatus Aerophobetes bacterium]|nr:nucleotide exchange factor GrpE [Candidatus Aerophobetes bacterium]